jgi:hypothetical protein
MAWLAVDEDGRAHIFTNCPKRSWNSWVLSVDVVQQNLLKIIGYAPIDADKIPDIIGKNITWKDDPVKI